MTHQNDYVEYDPERLPPVVVRYLDEHADPERRAAVAELFAPAARVVDEGIEYSGFDEIRGWLNKSASEYTFTITPRGQLSVDENRWVVLVRLEGTFPGGIVDLRYRISTEAGLITDLVIAV